VIEFVVALLLLVDMAAGLFCFCLVAFSLLFPSVHSASSAFPHHQIVAGRSGLPARDEMWPGERLHTFWWRSFVCFKDTPPGHRAQCLLFG
jgi:hypothetical protein